MNPRPVRTLGTETKTVSATDFVAFNGGNCYAGESFGGVKVALERNEEGGLVEVR